LPPAEPARMMGIQLNPAQPAKDEMAVLTLNPSDREQSSRSRDQLRLLFEVSEAIASHGDLTELFRDLARRLPTIVPFEVIALFLHDPDKHVMRVHMLGTADAERIPPGMEIDIDQSYSGEVFKTQRPVIVGNLDEARRYASSVALAERIGVESFCMLPLTTIMRPLGAIGFGRMRPHAFGAEEVDFLGLVAKQVAVGVDNVLHDESDREMRLQLERQRDRLQLLLEVNNAVVSHLNMNEMFVAISASLQRVIQQDGCSLLLFDPETRQYRVHVLLSNGEEFIEEGLANEPLKCPAGEALLKRQPVILGEQDLRKMTECSEMAQRLLDQGVKSFCSVPLVAHDRQLGALNAGRFCDTPFSQAEVELLALVAQQVAIAVENGLAYKKIDELKEKLNKEKLYLEEEIKTNYNFEEIIGESPAIRETLQKIVIVAPTDSTVLIQGETGTGKELIARAIHNLSGRKSRTFVKLNCAAIPTGLLESELFGHERGAFTGAIAQKVGRFELANGGTLFLDEVGDIPLELQSKFLRVLQEQEFERLGGTKTIKVDVRLVAATNRDLSSMVANKEFRSDLFYRLNVFPVMNPPLRDRREDVPRLVQHFTKRFARRMNKRIETIPAETMTTLSRYHWPGNIRELENFIERAVILSRGSNLEAPLGELVRFEAEPATADSDRPATTLEEAEREHIRRALDQSNWLVGGPSGAAARLGMKRTTLQSRIAKLGIKKDHARS
jgi:formate hydrogenlyase transcriptional activator